MEVDGEKFIFRPRDNEANPGTRPYRPYLYFTIFISLYIVSLFLNVPALYFTVLIGISVLILGFYSTEYIIYLIPIVLSNPIALGLGGTNLILSELILLILFGIYLLQFHLYKRSYIFPNQFLLLSVVIIAASLVSLLGANHKYPGLLQVIRYIEILLVLYFVIVNSCNDKKCFHKILISIIIGGGISSLIGLYQFVAGASALGYSVRAYGLLGAGYGAVMSATSMFCIGVLIHEKKTNIRILSILVLPVTLVGLLLNQTRTWIGSFLIVLLFLLIWKSRAAVRHLFLISLIGISAFLLMLYTNFFGLVEQDIFISAIRSAFRFGPRTGTYSMEDISLFLRFNVWQYAVGLFMQNPIVGIGVGNLRFIEYFPPKLGVPGPQLGYVDNQFIQFFTEIGILGGVAWIIYVTYAVKISAKNLMLTAKTEFQSIAFGLYGSILIFIIGSLFWVVTPSHELFAYLVMLVALSSSMNLLLRRSE